MDKLEIINIWLDDTGDFGVIQAEDGVFGYIYYPIESLDKSKNKYNTVNGQYAHNYSLARRIISPYIKGRLSKKKGEEIISDIEVVDGSFL